MLACVRDGASLEFVVGAGVFQRWRATQTPITVATSLHNILCLAPKNCETDRMSCRSATQLNDRCPAGKWECESVSNAESLLTWGAQRVCHTRVDGIRSPRRRRVLCPCCGRGDVSTPSALRTIVSRFIAARTYFFTDYCKVLTPR